MSKIQNDWSRRKFIAAVTGTGAAIMFNPFSSFAIDNIDPEVARIVANTLGIDIHNHIDVPLNANELPGPKADLTGEMKRSGLSAIVMTFAVDYQKLNNPGEAYDRFKNGLTAMDKLLEANGMTRALNLADLKAAKSIKKPIVIQSVEGAHFLEGKIERLADAYKRGLRHLGLLHDDDASVPLGDIFTNPSTWGGLTAFGADVIKECERLGILVDLSHCDETTLNGALRVATKPVLVSHTGLNTRLGKNENMANMMMPRLISKEQAKLIADNDGVIGVWTHLADSPTEYAENVKALVDIVGVDHVAIGTDTKMTPPYRSSNDKWEEPKEKLNGKANDGNDKNATENNSNDEGKKRGGNTTNTIWPEQKNGFYYAVVEAMLKTGFKENQIEKISGGNYCRIFHSATKGH